jgi:hypothetical protein
MPGAPNRPPEAAAAPAVAKPTPEPPELKVLRRIVPSQVALLQESWKGGAPPEVLAPYERADAAYRAGDYANASTGLDQLSIRFAEPRWPSLPEPFRRLRVPIPAPVPPHWDPDHGVSAEEKELRRARHAAEDQLALVDGCVGWASAHGVAVGDLPAVAATARAALAAPGVPSEFYPAVDRIWRALRESLPAPRAPSGKPAVAAAADGA